LTIRSKLTSLLTLTGLTAAGVTGLLSWTNARESLQERAFEQLTAVREIKADQIQAYFAQIRDHLLALAEDPAVSLAARELRESFAQLSPEPLDPARDQELRALYQDQLLGQLAQARGGSVAFGPLWPNDPRSLHAQSAYLARNPFETGSKHLLDAAEDGSAYSAAHRRHHPLFRSILERFGYYDVFLIEPESGYVVYSVFKEVDFGTSLRTGPYRQTNLAQAFEAARAARAPGIAHLVDFAPYPPSYDQQASFMASPVFADGEVIAVLVFQMPVDRINAVMTSSGRWADVGQGASGETYLVAGDGTLRNQPRFLLEDEESYLRQIAAAGLPSNVVRQIAANKSAIGLQAVDTPGVAAGFLGEPGRQIFPDYRGVRVLSAYRPVDVGDVRWVLLSEIDEAEAMAPAAALRDRALAWTALMLPLLLLLAYAVARTFTRPVRALTLAAARLSRGDLDEAIPVTGTDELSQLAQAFEDTRCSLKEMIEHQERSIDALAAPLIPLQDEVVVLPLVGELDRRRLDRVRTSLVEGLYHSRARVALLDLTGVSAVDHDVAAGLARVASAARLVGAQVILTGLQPEAAKTIADLDVPLESVRTERTIQSAIALAQRIVEGSATSLTAREAPGHPRG
jgi:anti-anti-sigma regulatory factor/HAMP domain-containing protein